MKNRAFYALALCCLLLIGCASSPSYMASDRADDAGSDSELQTPMPSDVLADYITIACERHNFSSDWLTLR